MLGYIRPEYDYVSKESLIEDIKIDCEVAGRSLDRRAYVGYREEGWLREFAWREGVDVGRVEREVLGEAKM
jgi:riboflavin kinase